LQQITFRGEQFIAKRFYNVGAGKDQVTIEENEHEIVQEATRLQTATWLYEKFQDYAREKSIDIIQSMLSSLFRFSDAYSFVHQTFKLPNASLRLKSLTCLRHLPVVSPVQITSPLQLQRTKTAKSTPTEIQHTLLGSLSEDVRLV
jgi:hypothetical protein